MEYSIDGITYLTLKQLPTPTWALNRVEVALSVFVPASQASGGTVVFDNYNSP